MLGVRVPSGVPHENPRVTRTLGFFVSDFIRKEKLKTAYFDTLSGGKGGGTFSLTSLIDKGYRAWFAVNKFSS